MAGQKCSWSGELRAGQMGLVARLRSFQFLPRFQMLQVGQRDSQKREQMVDRRYSAAKGLLMFVRLSSDLMVLKAGQMVLAERTLMFVQMGSGSLVPQAVRMD